MKFLLSFLLFLLGFVSASSAQFVYGVSGNTVMWMPIDSMLADTSNGHTFGIGSTGTVTVAARMATQREYSPGGYGLSHPVGTTDFTRLCGWPNSDYTNTAPTITLTPGDDAITVTITPATNQLFQMYRIQYRVYSATPLTWYYVNSYSRTFTITGLQSGVNYAVSARVVYTAAFLSSLSTQLRSTTL